MKILKIAVSITIVLFLSNSPQAMDMNEDGKEGLAEAIHALQVAAGMTPATPDPGTASAGNITEGQTAWVGWEKVEGVRGRVWGCDPDIGFNTTQCEQDCLLTSSHIPAISSCDDLCYMLYWWVTQNSEFRDNVCGSY